MDQWMDFKIPDYLQMNGIFKDIQISKSKKQAPINLFILVILFLCTLLLEYR